MIDKRISYYTKKVASLGTVHVSKRDERWYRRADRLDQYRKAMQLRINMFQ